VGMGCGNGVVGHVLAPLFRGLQVGYETTYPFCEVAEHAVVRLGHRRGVLVSSTFLDGLRVNVDCVIRRCQRLPGVASTAQFGFICRSYFGGSSFMVRT
jgi:hypothetical protein